jgi:hypothetical protein
MSIPPGCELRSWSVSRIDIGIPELDEPLLTFSAVIRDQNGVDTPIDLTGASIAWVSKATSDATDASGTTIAGGIVNPATNGVFTVQITNTVTATTGRFFYKVVVTKSARPLTVQFGDLLVINV